MKAAQTTTCIGFILLLGIVSVVQAASLNLASAWLFEENSGKAVSDTVGDANGEIKGNLKWVAGKVGRGLEFLGAGDSYVQIPHNDVFNSDPYTITVWTKLKAASWQYVIWRNGEVWPEAENVRHMDIWIHDADYPVFMWHTENGTQGRIDGQTIVADDQWHHIAKVYDGATVQMYIDGKLDGEAPSQGKLATSESPMWIGARPGNVAATGIIDEVGLFAAALSEAEIADVMDEGLVKFASVEANGKLTTRWGDIKRK